MKLPKNDRPRYSLSLIFSVILHVVIFSYVVKTPRQEKTAQTLANHPRLNNQVALKLDEIKFITKKQLQEIKGKQVVASESNGKKESPKDSHFVGAIDQTFDRQTMAAKNGAFKSAGLGNKNGSESSVAQSSLAATAPKKAAKANKAKSKVLSLSELGTFEVSKIKELEKAEDSTDKEIDREIASTKKNSAALGIERGSAETIGMASNNDFVEEVPLGDMTNLNTTEFKYYGFYHRIRQQLEQYWGSNIQSKAKNLYRSGRRLPASENLITAITVTLDVKGNILDIKIDGTSGIRELDQAAIESFNKAGPFPNPPKGLLVGGRAVIQWGFVVKG